MTFTKTLVSLIMIAALFFSAKPAVAGQYVAMAGTACVDDSDASQNVYHNWLGGAYNMSVDDDYFTCGYVRSNATACTEIDPCGLASPVVYVLDGRNNAYVTCRSIVAEYNGSYTEGDPYSTGSAFTGYTSLALDEHSGAGVATKYLVRCLLPANSGGYSAVIAFRGFVH